MAASIARDTVTSHHTDSKQPDALEGGALKGVIRTIAPVAFGQSIFVKPAAQFIKDHPGITIEWRLTDDDINFTEENCDVWIKIGTVRDETLVVRELAHLERLVVGTPECLANYGGVALEAMPWLTFGSFESTPIELFDQNGPARVFSVMPKFASDNIIAVREAAMQGGGIAIIPHCLVASELESGKLVDIVPARRAARLPLSLAIGSGATPPLVEQFCKAIQSWCDANLSRSD